jgi:hypothetical protein
MPQGAGSQDWLKLSSFDATSFFAQQQLDQDLQRAAQGKQHMYGPCPECRLPLAGQHPASRLPPPASIA